VSWQNVNFLDVCNIQGGTQPPKSTFVYEPTDGYVRLLQIQDFKRGDKAIYVPDKKTLKLCKRDDVLIARYGASLGKILSGKEGAYNVALAKTIPDTARLDKTYLKFYLRSDFFQNFLRNVGTRAAQAGFNRGDLSELSLPLPPLPIQKQIAAVLEKADNLRQQSQQMEQELNSLAQSVFLDMFGDVVSNEKGWNLFRFGEVCSSQLGKMLSSKAKAGESPKKYLRNANVRWRKIETDDLLEMDFNEKEQKKFTLQPGDLLVCEGGEVGRCAIWQGQMSECYYQKALHRVRVDKKLLTPEYVQEYLYWMAKLGGLSASVSEVTFSHLTADKLAKLPIPIPPLELQQRFVQIVNAVTHDMSSRLAEREYYDELFNSLMQRAFKGELDLKDVA